MYSILPGLPEAQFNLENWNNSGSRFNGWYAKRPDTDCGSSACAVGWATYYPEFIEQGLKRTAFAGAPAFMGEEAWDAVTAFFGLTHDEAQLIFGSDKYGRPAIREVMKQIRLYLLKKNVITVERNDELDAMERHTLPLNEP